MSSVFKAAPYSYVGDRMKRDLDNFVDEMTGPESDTTITVYADGETTADGDMDINEALDWIHSHANPRIQSATGQYSGAKRSAQITLSLNDGTHTLDSSHQRLENVRCRVVFVGSDQPIDEAPYATIDATGVANDTFNFVHCLQISLNSVEINGHIRALMGTRMDFNTGKGQESYTNYNTVVTGSVQWETCSRSYTCFKLKCAKLYASEGSSIWASTTTFDSSNDPFPDTYMGYVKAEIGALVSLQTPIVTNLGAGGTLHSSAAMFVATNGGTIIVEGNIDIPASNDATAVGVICNQASRISVTGDFDLNTRTTAGEAASTTLTADGSNFSVTGTYTP